MGGAGENLHPPPRPALLEPTYDVQRVRRERRAHRADQCGTLYVVSFMCLTGAAAFLVLSALCWAGVVAMVRSW